MTTKIYYIHNGERKEYPVIHTEAQDPVAVFKGLGIEYDEDTEPDINPPTIPDEDEG